MIFPLFLRIFPFFYTFFPFFFAFLFLLKDKDKQQQFTAKMGNFTPTPSAKPTPRKTSRLAAFFARTAYPGPCHTNNATVLVVHYGGSKTLQQGL